MEAVYDSLYELVFGAPDFSPLYGSTQGVLLSQARPLVRLCLLEVRHGGDKLANGHRADSVSICNGVVLVGGFCELIFYSDEHVELLREYLTSCDGIIVRVAPGVYPGVTLERLHELLREMAAAGKTVFPHPDVEDVMGSKRALCLVSSLQCGLPDTRVYTSRAEMWEGLCSTAAFQPRVLKADRGKGGEGVWWVRLKSGKYCATLGERVLRGDELLVLREMNDGHEEEHMVREFIEFCAAGRTADSGLWASEGIGRYLLEDRQPMEVNFYQQRALLVDQAYLPAVAVDGVVTCVMRQQECVELHVRRGNHRRAFPPTHPPFAPLVAQWARDAGALMAAVQLPHHSLPLWWTADVVNHKTGYALCDLDVACVDVPCVDVDAAEAKQASPQRLRHLVGVAAATAVRRRKFQALYGGCTALNEQPLPAVCTLCVLEVRDGDDKAGDGHRADSVPICNAIIGAGGFCEPIFYSDEHVELLREYLTSCDGIIVRVAPGVYPGVTLERLHELLREMAAAGKTVFPHPDVVSQLGSKRALCLVGGLELGMPDTRVYTSRAEMWEGLCSTAAFQPRVLTLNDGEGGERVWLVRLKSGKYCATLGERVLRGDELLVLREMTDDSREEEHTVADCVQLCMPRLLRSIDSADCLGGAVAIEHEVSVIGGFVVDQRFMPRMAEGEVRCLMVGGVCIEVVHKQTVAAQGADDAVGRPLFAKYKPDDMKFGGLMRRWGKDMERLMEVMGLRDEPLPLVWMVDFVLGMQDADGADTYTFSAFHVGTVDISQQLYVVETLGVAAVKSTLLRRFAPLYGHLTDLLPRPTRPTARLCVLEVRDGDDKAGDGHRADSVPICNAIIGAGGFCEPIFYSDEHVELLREYLTSCDGIIVRVAPGVYPGVTLERLHELLREMAAAGKTVFPHPDVEDVMGSKRALCLVSSLQCGLPDTRVYTSRAEMWEGLCSTAAFQPRVLTLNDGEGGERVWLVRLKSGKYCATLGERVLRGDELLVLREMTDDSREEEHTVADVVHLCAGRTPWGAKGPQGSTSDGGCLSDDGQVLDQRQLEGVGHVRCIMMGGVCLEVHVSAAAHLVKFAPSDGMYAPLVARWEADAAQLMAALGVGGQPLPLLWTADLVTSSAPGEALVLVKLSCALLCIAGQLYLADRVGRAALATTRARTAA